jgi:hypothetical protein
VAPRLLSADAAAPLAPRLPLTTIRSLLAELRLTKQSHRRFNRCTALGWFSSHIPELLTPVVKRMWLVDFLSQYACCGCHNRNIGFGCYEALPNPEIRQSSRCGFPSQLFCRRIRTTVNLAEVEKWKHVAFFTPFVEGRPHTSHVVYVG